MYELSAKEASSKLTGEFYLTEHFLINPRLSSVKDAVMNLALIKMTCKITSKCIILKELPRFEKKDKIKDYSIWILEINTGDVQSNLQKEFMFLPALSMCPILMGKKILHYRKSMRLDFIDLFHPALSFLVGSFCSVCFRA